MNLDLARTRQDPLFFECRKKREVSRDIETKKIGFGQKKYTFERVR